ncbi:MAG: phosphoglycerate mutase, partial [Chrysiogenales bacterium]
MKPTKNSKYIILVGDGMADHPIESLGGKTPLEQARTPRMDLLASRGVLGLVRTVPEGMPPGSDIANLSLMGYDPRVSFSGRAPLEALNMGIELGPKDLAIRCNMVEIERGVMHDFSAGHISSEFSALVMRELAEALDLPDIEFYPGVSYRNILV